MRINAILIASIASLAYARPFDGRIVRESPSGEVGVPKVPAVQERQDVPILGDDLTKDVPDIKRQDLGSLTNIPSILGLGGLKERETEVLGDVTKDVPTKRQGLGPLTTLTSIFGGLKERENEVPGDVADSVPTKRQGFGSLTNLTSIFGGLKERQPEVLGDVTKDVPTKRQGLGPLTTLTSIFGGLKERENEVPGDVADSVPTKRQGFGSLTNLTSIFGGLKEREPEVLDNETKDAPVKRQGFGSLTNLTSIFGSIIKERETELLDDVTKDVPVKRQSLPSTDDLSEEIEQLTQVAHPLVKERQLDSVEEEIKTINTPLTSRQEEEVESLASSLPVRTRGVYNVLDAAGDKVTTLGARGDDDSLLGDRDTPAPV